jgi:hypothetical protein
MIVSMAAHETIHAKTGIPEGDIRSVAEPGVNLPIGATYGFGSEQLGASMMGPAHRSKGEI